LAARPDLHRKKIKFQDMTISPTQLSITKSIAGEGMYFAQIGCNTPCYGHPN
jgi:hypothetical protein